MSIIPSPSYNKSHKKPTTRHSKAPTKRRVSELFQVSRTGPFGGNFNTFRGTGCRTTEHSRRSERRRIQSEKASVSPPGPHTREMVKWRINIRRLWRRRRKRIILSKVELEGETYAKWLIDRNECFEFPEA